MNCSCFAQDDATVKCWGYNLDGQLGIEWCSLMEHPNGPFCASLVCLLDLCSRHSFILSDVSLLCRISCNRLWLQLDEQDHLSGASGERTLGLWCDRTGSRRSTVLSFIVALFLWLQIAALVNFAFLHSR